MMRHDDSGSGYELEYKAHVDDWEMSSESGNDTFDDFEEFQRQLA